MENQLAQAKALKLGRKYHNKPAAQVPEMVALLGENEGQALQLLKQFERGRKQKQADLDLSDERLKEAAKWFGGFMEAFKVAMEKRRYVYSEEFMP